MVRKAVIVGLALITSSASAQKTNCVWIGQTLSCDTQPSGATLPDFGKIMQSGMDSVPKYVAPTYTTPQTESPLEYEPIDGELAIEQCELDWPAIQQPDHPRRKQKAFFGGYLSTNDRVQYMQICSAYIKGKLSVLQTEDK